MTEGAWICLALLVSSIGLVVWALGTHAGDINEDERQEESKRVSRRLKP
jgi:hypothetical protein